MVMTPARMERLIARISEMVADLRHEVDVLEARVDGKVDCGCQGHPPAKPKE